MATTGTPCSLAHDSPSASGRFEMTTAGSAGKSGSRIALISDCMFEPRPEIRMAVRFLGCVMTLP